MSGNGIQVDDGEFTRLHNTILEKLALARLNASEFRCLMYLFRITYGWQKKEDEISLSQWAKGTGIDPEKRHNVWRTLQGLLAKRVIYAIEHGNNKAPTWGFNKHFEQWDDSLFELAVIEPDNSDSGEGEPSVINADNGTVIKPDNTPVIKDDSRSVISADNYKRNRKKEEKKGKEKPRARSRSGDSHPNTRPIMDAYVEALGYKPTNYGKELSAAKKIAVGGHTPADVSAAYAILKQELFWQRKHLSLQVVAEQIPALHQALVKGVPMARAPTHVNGHMSKGERQEAEVEKALQLVREREQHVL